MRGRERVERKKGEEKIPFTVFVGSALLANAGRSSLPFSPHWACWPPDRHHAVLAPLQSGCGGHFAADPLPWSHLSSPLLASLPQSPLPLPICPPLAMSTFGRFFRVTTFGESHCRGVGAIVDGVPPRLALEEDDIQAQLSRRRPGQSKLTTARNEADQVRVGSYRAQGREEGGERGRGREKRAKGRGSEKTLAKESGQRPWGRQKAKRKMYVCVCVSVCVYVCLCVNIYVGKSSAAHGEERPAIETGKNDKSETAADTVFVFSSLLSSPKRALLARRAPPSITPHSPRVSALEGGKAGKGGREAASALQGH